MDIKKLIAAVGEGEGTEQLLIVDALDKLLLNEKPREDRVGMHGSGIIASDNEFCYRRQVLSFFYRGMEPNHPVKLLRIFLNGWYVHEKWQKLFKDAGMSLGSEVRGESNEFSLLFTPDDIVKIGNKKYVVEIKSVNTYQFQHMKSHPSAKKQLMLYMHMLCIPNGFVLCEDKNTQEVKVFVYRYNPEEARPFVERMLMVKKFIRRFIKTGKLPDRCCKNEKTKQASNCAMCNACFNIKRVPIDKQRMAEIRKGWE
jgi:hypothetical protein